MSYFCYTFNKVKKNKKIKVMFWKVQLGLHCSQNWEEIMCSIHYNREWKYWEIYKTVEKM